MKKFSLILLTVNLLFVTFLLGNTYEFNYCKMPTLKSDSVLHNNGIGVGGNLLAQTCFKDENGNKITGQITIYNFDHMAMSHSTFYSSCAWLYNQRDYRTYFSIAIFKKTGYQDLVIFDSYIVPPVSKEKRSGVILQKGNTVYYIDGDRVYVGQYSYGKINGKAAMYDKSKNKFYFGQFSNNQFVKGVVFNPENNTFKFYENGLLYAIVHSYKGEAYLFDANNEQIGVVALPKNYTGFAQAFYDIPASSDLDKYKRILAPHYTNGKLDDGKYLYSNGYYIGKFSDGKRNGLGVYVWNNGDKYDGYWVNGERTGQGTYIWHTGEKYVGNWENSKRNGYGKMYDADGNLIIEGYWTDDKCNNCRHYSYDNNDDLLTALTVLVAGAAALTSAASSISSSSSSSSSSYYSSSSSSTYHVITWEWSDDDWDGTLGSYYASRHVIFKKDGQPCNGCKVTVEKSGDKYDIDIKNCDIGLGRLYRWNSSTGKFESGFLDNCLTCGDPEQKASSISEAVVIALNDYAKGYTKYVNGNQ